MFISSVRHDRIFQLLIGSALTASLLFSCSNISAQVQINDKLTGERSLYDWIPFDGACLTAGDGSGKIPKCEGLSTYAGKIQVGGVNGRLPDPVGYGALRLTNGDFQNGTNGNDHRGAVVSNFTFPASQGLKVNFTSYTYGGNSFGPFGADGISFYLSDGLLEPSVGAIGGSLGYQCGSIVGDISAIPVDGVKAGVIGLGIDEYGNYTTHWNNNGSRAISGIPGAIAIRGKGNIYWSYLHENYPHYYPEHLSEFERRLSVVKTCRTGFLYNYSDNTRIDVNGRSVPSGQMTTEPVAAYPVLNTFVLPSTMPIPNQLSTFTPKRSLATPIKHFIELSTDGKLTYNFSYNGGNLINVFNEYKIDRLPEKLRFGFAASTGGGSNVHEVSCFRADSLSQSFSSLSSNARNQQRVEGGSQVFFALQKKRYFSGSVIASDLVVNGGKVAISPVPNWDANCVLSGGDCSSTSQAYPALNPSSRVVLTWSGRNGMAMDWDALPNHVKFDLNGDGFGKQRLAYLQGFRQNESFSTAPSFRKREGLLGDIVHSSPVWVGPPQSPYGAQTKNMLHNRSMSEMVSYAAFKAAQSNRLNVVYVGANDGFLHGFRAGYGQAVSGQSRDNDGKEVLAYAPMKMLKAIHSPLPQLDFSNHNYSHNYYVDAQPGSGDVFVDGKWQTWLAGGFGYGGERDGPKIQPDSTGKGGFYLLNVTNPTDFNASNADKIVLGEWDSDSIGCVNLSSCGRHLGYVSGVPVIRRLHDGSWAAIFGNGTFSQSGEAGIFLVQGKPNSDEITVRFLRAGGPTEGKKNGIVSVSAADIDGDRVVDYVYAGDVLGNIWRFDVSSTNASDWSALSRPIFRTGGAPITTKIEVSQWVPTFGMPKVLLTFGSGQLLPQTMAGSEKYSQQAHALYGVWDGNFHHWNQRSSQTVATHNINSVIDSLRLQKNSITDVQSGSVGLRTIQSLNFCWLGDSFCVADAGKLGWQIDLPANNEQIIFNPVSIGDLVLFTTTIPAKVVDSCDEPLPSGYTMAVSLRDGAAPSKPFFLDYGGGFLGDRVVAGLSLSGVGSPMIVNANRESYLVQQTVSSNPVATRVRWRGHGDSGRISWKRLR